MPRVVIIGNGIAGVTAARHIRKQVDWPIHIISSESKHFFSRTALMYLYMGHMEYRHIKPYEDHFWEQNRLSLVEGHVTKIDTESRILLFADGRQQAYDVLIVAAGSKPNKFGWPGETLQGVGGLYSLQDLAYMEKHSKGLQRAVIVGGGLIGIEMAEMFHSRHIPVTFLVREKSYWDHVLPAAESGMINQEIRRHGVDLRLATELKEVLPNPKGHVRAVLTDKGEEISCGFVGLTAGVGPNIGFLEGSGIACNKGVLVNRFFETNVPNVYAIGDCAEFEQPLPGRQRLEQVWYTGRMHGETVAQTIVGKRTPYAPGPWFNSAKFFTIEYQVYGEVPTKMPEGWEELYWEHRDGRKSIRVVWDGQSGSVKGFNLMGIRFRHERCDEWIRQQRPIAHVLSHLHEANFDPEFYPHFEQEVVEAFNKKYPKQAVKPKPAKGFWRRLFT